MPVINAGISINDFLGVPSDVVIIQPPNPTTPIVSTGTFAVVGTSIGGAVNSPVRGSFQNLLTTFGNPQNVTFDAMTQAYIANLQGANDFIIVRVTDGTDLAATVNLLDVTTPTALTGLTLTSRFTGTLANTLQATLSTGTNSTPSVLTYKLTVFYPGQVAEVFDNVGGTGNAFWVNLANAVNLGQSSIRAPSQLVTATATSITTVPALTTYTLSGGTTGNSGVTSTTLIGTDGLTRTGMYVLRNTAADVAVIADLTDTTKWSTVQSFANQTLIYFGLSGVNGQQDSISTAVTALQNTGVNNPFVVGMLGDWPYFNDQFNNVTRLGNPAAFRQGTLATLNPWESVANKPIFGIVATQKSQENRHYSQAEKAALRDGRLDVIGSPSAGGTYFSALIANNTSSNNFSNRDNYPRMNRYLSESLDGLLGAFVGLVYSVTVLDQMFSSITGFLQPLKIAQNIIDFSVTILPPSAPNTNNPQSMLDQGIVNVTVQVKLAAIIINILCNLQANQGVTISISTQPITGV